jgi:hypothetical protein
MQDRSVRKRVLRIGLIAQVHAQFLLSRFLTLDEIGIF